MASERIRISELALKHLSDEEYDLFNAFYLKADLGFYINDQHIQTEDDLKQQLASVREGRLCDQVDKKQDFIVPAFDHESDFCFVDLTGEQKHKSPPIYCFYK